MTRPERLGRARVEAVVMAVSKKNVVGYHACYTEGRPRVMILSADIGSTCTYVEKLISWCSRNAFWKQEGNTDGNLFVQGLLADYRQICWMVGSVSVSCLVAKHHLGRVQRRQAQPTNSCPIPIVSHQEANANQLVGWVTLDSLRPSARE